MENCPFCKAKLDKKYVKTSEGSWIVYSCDCKKFERRIKVDSNIAWQEEL